MEQQQQQQDQSSQQQSSSSQSSSHHDSPFSPVGRAVLSKGPILLSPGGSFPSNVFTKSKSDSQGNSSNEVHSDGFEKKYNIDTAPVGVDDNTKILPPTTSSFSMNKEKHNDNNASDNIYSNEVSMTNDNIEQEEKDQTKHVTMELFGGAISSLFPSTFEDVSVIRQVPDHQEVFVDKITDMSCIVELLSYDESISDINAAQHYFQDLAQCNEASEYSIDSTAVVVSSTCMPCISGSYSCCALVGRQIVAKFYRRPDGPLNNVQILLFVIRLPVVGTDILITLNIPYSQSESNVPMITTSSFLSLIPLSLDEPTAVDIMRHILKNFSIIDWSLFA